MDKKKRSFLCSCCARSLPVGSWYEGHWFCFWCYRQVSEQAQTKVKHQHASVLKRKAVVEIEEIGQEL